MNYRVATSLNPYVSTSLHPRVSTSKNPNVASNIDGLFLWNLELSPVGFTVQANDRVRLIFTPDADFSGVLIEVRDDFWNEYDLDNEWNGYWVHARNNVWLRYLLESDWVGFTT